MTALRAIEQYDGTQDSGIEWLGDIPAHWQLRRLKFVVEIVKRIAGKEGFDVLSITQKGIKIKDVESGEGQLAMDYSKYQFLYQGEFAMNHMDLLTGYVDISKYDGVVSPDYRVFRNHSSDVLDAYLLLIFQIGYTQRIFYKYGQGVSFLGRWRFPADNFNSFFIPIPSLAEQQAIIDFVTLKTVQIDEAVAIKEKQIALLKERKQIIIQKAVTQGLDPNVPMKDSGVEWVGKVPEHWQVKAARYAFRVVRRNKRDGNEVKFSVTQKRGLVPTDEMEENSTQALTYENFQVCNEDDLVLNKYKAHLGVFWRAPYRGIVTNNYTVFKPLNGISSKYFELLYHTPPYVSLFRTLVYGVIEGMMPLYTNDFYGLKTLIPPYEEQKRIESHVSSVENSYAEAFNLLENQISKLKEYKATLINSAVTGKIKVV